MVNIVNRIILEFSAKTASKNIHFWIFGRFFRVFGGGEIRQKLGFPAITRPKMVEFCSNFYQILFVLFLGHCHILTHFGQIGAPGGSKKSQK